MKQNKQRFVVAVVGTLMIILLLLVGWLGLRGSSAGRMNEGADRVLGGTPPPGATQGRHQVYNFGLPDEWFVAGAVGQTYTETLSGADLRTGEAGVLLGQSSPDGPYITWHTIGRAYAGWDTSALPGDGEVLSATLVLERPADGGREEPLEISIYRGTWNPPIDLGDWRSPGGKEVGRWQLPASHIEEGERMRTNQGIVLYALEPARTVRVPLDPGVVEVDGITRLELRHAREDILPISAGIVPLGPSQIRLEVEFRP